jgi:hypothetical protein
LAELLNDGLPVIALESTSQVLREAERVLDKTSRPDLATKPRAMRSRIIEFAIRPERPAPAIGAILAQEFRDGGWTRIHLALVSPDPLGLELAEHSNPEIRRMWRQALLESLVFARCGFSIAWCEHRGHYFVSDDSRRKDCSWHRLAGQQARWRREHPTWKLKRQGG